MGEKIREKKCEHEWKQLGAKHGSSILELVCTKCGEKKEIYCSLNFLPLPFYGVFHIISNS